MMLGFFYMPYWWLMIPGALLAMWAHFRLRSTYAEFSQIGTDRGITGAQAAREIVTLIEQRKPVGVVPAWPWKWLRPFFGHFPDSLWNKLA